jgi:hypothetical protein
MLALGMSAPSFLQHNGKRLLRLDYAGLSPAAVVAYMKEAKILIAAEPPGSVRLLSVVAIRITDEVMEALRDFAAHNAPFVLATAIVGATPFQKAAIGLNIRSRGRLNVETFDDEQKAKDWLAAR